MKERTKLWKAFYDNYLQNIALNCVYIVKKYPSRNETNFISPEALIKMKKMLWRCGYMVELSEASLEKIVYKMELAGNEVEVTVEVVHNYVKVLVYVPCANDKYIYSEYIRKEE